MHRRWRRIAGHFPAPKGPKGRFLPLGAFSWGIWNFSPNKTAAKELIEFLSQRENVEARCNVTQGYDVPPFASMTDFKVWAEVEPPRGTVYNYPIRKSHHQENWIAVAPAPPEIAVQVYNRGTSANDAGQIAERPVDQASSGLGAGRVGRVCALGGRFAPCWKRAVRPFCPRHP